MSPAAASISAEERLDQVIAGERLQVGEVQRRAGAPRDLDQLADRLQHPSPSLRTCGTSGTPNAAASSATATSSSVLGVGARDVDEPEREHPGARLEPEPHQAAHLGQLRGRRRHPVGAEHRLPHGAVPDRRHQAHGRPAAIERLEVLGERRPGPLERPLALERPQVRLPRRLRARRDGSRRQPVGVDHLGREPLQDLRRVQRIREGHERRVGVEVDEARAEDRAGPSTTSAASAAARSPTAAISPSRTPTSARYRSALARDRPSRLG